MARATARPPAGTGDVPVPVIGDTVLYTLSETDAAAVNKRRDDWAASPPAAWGYQAHVGNVAAAGDVLPAQVTRVNGPSVNLRVHLDGSDVLWAPSRVAGDTPGTWFVWGTV